MKPIITQLLFFLIAVTSGTAIGYLFSDRLHGQADARLEILQELELDSAEFMAGIHLATIRAIERDDFIGALQWNCIFLKASLGRIRPERRQDDDQRRRVETLLKDAISTVDRLEEQALCDWP